MRLVTFRERFRPARFGVLHGDLVVDPDLVLAADEALRSGGTVRGGNGTDREPRVPREMVAFFESGEQGRALAQHALEVADTYRERGDELRAPDGSRAVLPAADVQLLAPVPRPRRIRDYLTYTEHAAGSGLDVPPAFAAMPICYKCNVETVIGPDEPLLWPSYTSQLDFELDFLGKILERDPFFVLRACASGVEALSMPRAPGRCRAGARAAAPERAGLSPSGAGSGASRAPIMPSRCEPRWLHWQ